MLPFFRAKLSLSRAIGLVESGRLNEALEVVRRARAQFEQRTNDHIDRRNVGSCWQLEGQALSALGRPDDALEAYTTALEWLSQDPRNAEEYGRCLFDIGVDLGDTLPALAIQFFQQAREVLAPFGGDYVETIDRNLIDLSEDVDWQVKLENVRAAKASASANSDEALRATHAEASLLITHGGGEDIRRGLAMLSGPLRTLTDRNDIELLFSALVPLSVAAFRPGAPTTVAFEEICAKAVQLAVRQQSPEKLAIAQVAKAASRALAGDRRGALGIALDAISTGDEITGDLASTIGRYFSAQRTDGARDLALRLAVDEGFAALAAELIETARPQTVPSERRTQMGGTTDPVFTELRTHPARHVSVNGRSELMSRRVQPSRPIPLESTIDAVGGRDAWWWGTATGFEGRHYWATRSPAGDLSCGETDLEAAMPLIETVIGALPSEDSDDSSAYFGPLNASYDDECDLMHQLGRLLVPEPLAAALRVAEKPLSLVISSNILVGLPLATLGVPGCADRRLVEVATVRIAPPAALVERMRDLPSPPVDVYPILISCTDPKGDLPHSTHGEVLAVQTFSGTNRGAKTAAAPATRANLLAALRELQHGEPGIFFYAGHATTGDIGNDENAGLALQDDPLLASDFFPTAERPALSSPARVLLAACSSSGASGAGRGEWLGLGAAFAIAGAKQIVATAWPVWDIPFTAAFDRHLLTALQTAADPGMAIRALQVEALEAWRIANHDVRGDTVAVVKGEVPLPLVWAAFQAIGLRGD